MNNLRQAAQQAFEALEQIAAYRPLTFAECSDAEAVIGIAENAIPSLRAALAEPKQEPVAWRDLRNTSPAQGCTYDRATHEKWPHIYSQPLYTAPNPRKPLPLTDEEIRRIYETHRASVPLYHAIARAIERAHGIKEQEHE